ncbi:dnaJ homolog subfamily C member 4-like isoform X2 [Ornithodoros turicata]|uniref:dnaJ homolog subfamily C member 4-like isoform X2 n=1 Tax=Ornithodoros turicata TaxID=34597 RepID=UPI003138B582
MSRCHVIRLIYCAPLGIFSIAYAKNYYEALGVNPSCTQAEIRDAYVKLCKLYHPDKKGEMANHERFTEINEAYMVLSRSSERKLYDENLLHTYQPYKSNMQRSNARPEEPIIFTNQQFRRETGAYYRSSSRPYDRRMKPYIVAGCIALMLAGALMHYLAYRYGRSRRMKEQMLERSRTNQEIHQQAKENYKKYGTDGQLQRIFGDSYKSESSRPP